MLIECECVSPLTCYEQLYQLQTAVLYLFLNYWHQTITHSDSIPSTVTGRLSWSVCAFACVCVFWEDQGQDGTSHMASNEICIQELHTRRSGHFHSRSQSCQYVNT